MTEPTAKVGAESRKRAKSPARGSKPGERRGGRQKGTPNKLTKTVKEAIEVAFDEIGGPAYLVKMSKEQPTAFLTLLGKIIPTQLQHTSPDGSMSPPSLADFYASLRKAAPEDEGEA